MASQRKRVQTQVDWSKVPVVIVGTPNPEAIRLIVESIREFEIHELLAKQQPSAAQQPAEPVVERGFSIS